MNYWLVELGVPLYILVESFSLKGILLVSGICSRWLHMLSTSSWRSQDDIVLLSARNTMLELHVKLRSWHLHAFEKKCVMWSVLKSELLDGTACSDV